MSSVIRIAVSIALATLFMQADAIAQGWPSRPVRILVPFQAGGSSDLSGRLVAQRMQEVLGQPVVVENRVGAGGTIATEAVARAAPDGYTLLLAVGGPVLIAPLLQKTGYHPIRDFVPISNVNSNPQVLLVNPSVQAASVRELIALARARPGKLNISTAGQGSLIELSALMFNQLAKIELAIVPYKGGAIATAAVLSAEVEATFANPSDAIPQVRAGKLRALGVTSAAAFAPMPEVPLMADVVPGFVVETWNGILAPVGTPSDIVHRISVIVQDMARDPGLRQRMADMGTTPIGDTPEQYRAFLEQQYAFWGRFVRDSGIKGTQ